MGHMTMTSLDELQERWKYLYQDYLPALAVAHDPAQKTWPVHLDHCFARIILDNALGNGRPWTDAVSAPAIKNMSVTQLQDTIELAEKVATGEVDLGDLDNRSLSFRGKAKKRKPGDQSTKPDALKKHKKATPLVSSYFLQTTSPTRTDVADNHEGDATKTLPERPSQDNDISVLFKRIANSDITTFRKQTLSLLCQIPRGRYSTYGTMANWISENSHKTCARAVGNAMRNNPFAPEVPCHRILAGDGTLGGFKGSWGEEGKYAKLKHELLKEEGVKFDSRGKVKGPPFQDFSKYWE